MDGKRAMAAAAVSACAVYGSSRCFVVGPTGVLSGASSSPSGRPQLHRSARSASAQRSGESHSRLRSVAVPAAVALGAGLRPRKSRQARIVRCADGLADCPYVLYGNKDIDVEGERKKLEVKACPLEVRMPAELKGDLEGQRQYFSSKLPQIYKDQPNQMNPCQNPYQTARHWRSQDPLHSVAARDAVDKKAGVYEAVNKPSRSKFYIGMHNEMVGNRAPGAALFVCFKAAEKGGEFLVADGRKMFKKLDQDWLSKVYNRDPRLKKGLNDVVYSTAEFPMGFIEGLPDFVKPAVEPMVYGAMTQALKMKVDFQTELRWEKSDYDGSKILQVRAMPQYPIETTGASRINKTDVFYGDDGEKIETEWLEHLDKVTLECAEKVKMEPGDMVLLDNYLVMHGRCPFEGTRLHAVSWFKSPDYSKAAA
eukprot:g814.t1